jgi:histone H4
MAEPQTKRRQSGSGIPLYIRKPGIKRLARKAGISRVSEPVYVAINEVTKTFLQNTIRGAVVVATLENRKTVQAKDVQFALNEKGISTLF